MYPGNYHRIKTRNMLANQCSIVHNCDWFMQEPDPNVDSRNDDEKKRKNKIRENDQMRKRENKKKDESNRMEPSHDSLIAILNTFEYDLVFVKAIGRLNPHQLRCVVGHVSTLMVKLP